MHYRYLKTLCDVLSALGIHLSDVWKRSPPNFEIYLRANEAFITHPSVVSEKFIFIDIMFQWSVH